MAFLVCGFCGGVVVFGFDCGCDCCGYVALVVGLAAWVLRFAVIWWVAILGLFGASGFLVVVVSDCLVCVGLGVGLLWFAVIMVFALRVCLAPVLFWFGFGLVATLLGCLRVFGI